MPLISPSDNPPKAWYLCSPLDTLAYLKTDQDQGLTSIEAAKRLHTAGPNKLQDARKKSPWRMLLAQFSDLLVLVLMGAAILASFLGEPEDAIAIVAIVILNGLLGFYQEFRAEKAMAALQSLAAPMARVRRSGQNLFIPSSEVVTGDLVLIEAGNVVPADIRLLEVHQMNIDESALTGESVPVSKTYEAMLKDHLALGDQKNIAFKGTIVTSGRALGVVVATGMATELGRIAKLLRDESEVKTPLQNRMHQFAKKLSIAVVLLCIVIFGMGLIRGEEPVLMFMTALSLAVAAIPEALPAVITVALALGARFMGARKALVRRLPAVEALGSVTYICSDKTGTLTQNQMQARKFYVKQDLMQEPPKGDMGKDPIWQMFGMGLSLNNDVTRVANGEWQGDPTEIALIVASIEMGLDKKELETQWPRIAEIPFTSERSMMTTVHKGEAMAFALVKGAPEKILPLCARDYAGQGWDETRRSAVKTIVDEMAMEGYRVLAVAYRDLSEQMLHGDFSAWEEGLSFLGLIGLIDPPREEAREAIQLCQTAGIHPVMITGDHPVTAKAIAKELGIYQPGVSEVVVGSELSQMSDAALQERVKRIAVYARVAPEQKIRIVKALQQKGEIVSMTGDGVNDAPALRRADVGVSMGKGGTDVAREASHMILMDDNFATIVAAIREGRRIYDNIRKFVRFALSGNSGEIWTLFLAPFLGLPVPLLPIHILWINLVTDGLPGLALAFEPEEKNLMRRPPRAPQESMFAHGLWQHALWVGLMTAAATLGTMAWAYHTGHAHWQSMAFTVLTFIQMGHVLAIRSERQSLFSQGVFSNLPLLGAVTLTLGLQLATLYVPAFNKVFKTEPLSMPELMVCVLASSSVFLAVEIEKYIRRSS